MTNRRNPAAPLWTMTWLVAFSAFAMLELGRSAWAQDKGEKASAPGAVTAESVLKKTTDFYKKAKSFSVDMNRSHKVGPINMQYTTAVAFERPNRLAMQSKGTVPGIDLISDGKKLFVSVPALKKYSESEAPAAIDALMTDPIGAAALQFMMIGELCTANAYEKLMESVKTATYSGREALDGADAHHLKFTQDQFDWDMWVAAEGDPLVKKVVVDLTKTLANSPAAAQFKNQKMEMTQNFKGWQIDRGVDAKSFAFEPPAGAKKVKSFMEGPGGGEETPSPLLGTAAPDVTLKLLEKGEFRLKEHKGEHVVMIDFWATWCGPCVQELPILTEVADSYKEKGVVFCAVNLRENTEQIQKFLTDKKLKMTVALDSDAKVATSYHVEAIPMLVLVDKKGTVQSVHVGYNPGIKATLRSELDALLAGKDLTKEKDAHGSAKTTSNDK